MAPSRIINQYTAFCEEYAPGFSRLQPRSLFKILEICKTSYRKSLQGLNYFAADGDEAFDFLSKIVQDLNLNSNLAKRLRDNLKRGRQYMKSDFKTQISKSNSVADHRAMYALSDTKNSNCREICDHLHDAYCIEFEMLSSTLNEIEKYIKEQSNDEEVTERSLTIFYKYKESINNWKCHLLRSVNQDIAREHCLNFLPDDGIFIYLGWAMKWLPAKYREPQSYFFGKRGLSWQIAVAIKKIPREAPNTSTESYSDNESSNDEENLKDSKPSLSQKVFVHVFDSCSEDSSAILCTIENVLKEIHVSDPIIKAAFLRSDDAGCYHRAETLLSLPFMAKKTGITVQGVDFSDPQGVHHLATGKHVRKPAKHLLKDTAIQLYKSKLERMGNLEMISLMLETSNIEDTIKSKEKFSTGLREGWALSKERKNARLSVKQTQFLLEKFNEGVRTFVRWKPEVLVTKMHELKVNGKFNFTASEFLMASPIRSFFSREKAKRQKFQLNENDTVDQENEFFQDDLALEEISDREALRQECEKALDEEEQTENSVQLTRAVKHNVSTYDISDKRRSSFSKRKL
ncbi:unnamed protein product [Rotaria magnacalcarata]|uniref:Uncharacterized protein n=1 Tax=Rotaria magnacalcarata TaxID=392030 RepID=A0A819Y2V7_9BILA|nr:unnamed protein product [Rotaria magnacalcarata]CAF4151904.1 unnamed protein product [Rotaria magnacalcarata]